MLYICPTPIGNLEDITLRVLETLRTVELIAAEDTRRTLKLLSHYGISKPLISFFEHNEVVRLEEILARLRAGGSVALVSDAGMPGISDPGYRLVSAALDEGLPVDVLPGPSAVETALVSSGFSTDTFVFLGYLPRRRGDLKKALEYIAAQPHTAVAFEAPHRLKATLGAAAEVMGERQMAICRELTKKFQEIKRGSAAALSAALRETVKGEIVLVFAAADRAAAEAAVYDEKTAARAMRSMLESGLSARKTAELVAALSGMPRNRAYRLALDLKE